GMIGLGTALGVLYAMFARIKLPATGYRSARREWVTAAAFALVMTLGATLLFWTETAQNFFGLPYVWARFVTILSLLADFGLYAVVLCLFYRAILPNRRVGERAEARQTGRQFPARAGAAVFGLGAPGETGGVIQGLLKNYPSYDGVKTFTANGFIPPITP